MVGAVRAQAVRRRGAFDGVIVASLDPAFLSRFYTSLNIGHGAVLLLGEDGIVRSAAPDDGRRAGQQISPQYGCMTARPAEPHGTRAG